MLQQQIMLTQMGMYVKIAAASLNLATK